MTIIGIGCDVVQIPRISALYAQHGVKFLRRILSKHEIVLMPTETQEAYIAKRYAAKEAFGKAIGKGIGKDFKFNDIEVLKSCDGKPYFSNKTIAKLQNLFLNEAVTAHVSLSDDFPIAMAYVVISH